MGKKSLLVFRDNIGKHAILQSVSRKNILRDSLAIQGFSQSGLSFFFRI